MADPSPAAIEAAAEALLPYAEYGSQADDMACAALAAALPIIRAELAEAIETTGRINPTHTRVPSDTWAQPTT